MLSIAGRCRSLREEPQRRSGCSRARLSLDECGSFVSATLLPIHFGRDGRRWSCTRSLPAPPCPRARREGFRSQSRIGLERMRSATVRPLVDREERHHLESRDATRTCRSKRSNAFPGRRMAWERSLSTLLLVELVKSGHPMGVKDGTVAQTRVPRELVPEALHIEDHQANVRIRAIDLRRRRDRPGIATGRESAAASAGKLRNDRHANDRHRAEGREQGAAMRPRESRTARPTRRFAAPHSHSQECGKATDSRASGRPRGRACGRAALLRRSRRGARGARSRGTARAPNPKRAHGSRRRSTADPMKRGIPRRGR